MSMVDQAKGLQIELILPTRAQAVGLRTARDAKVAFVRQAPHWWNGDLYYCPLCDQEFRGADTAARHVVAHQHPVLRWEPAALSCPAGSS